MRVTDRALQDSYLVTYRNTKDRLRKIQEQITNQSKVNRPSDDPLANSKIMRLNGDLDSLEMYQSNISTSSAEVETTIGAMTGMQQQIEDAILKLTLLNSSTADSQLGVFADQFDNIINSLLDYANTESGGNYTFGGTNLKTKPIGFNAGNTAIEIKSPDLSGERNVNISQTSTQKINITGEELLQPIFKQQGNLDSTAAVGPIANNTHTIYNADGTAHTLRFVYTKTAANTYDFTPSVDTLTPNFQINGQTVNPPYSLAFNATSGALETINGNPLKNIHMTDPANKLDFVVDLTNISETTSATSLSVDNDQEVDIFNTLISIRDGLRAGNRPNAKQVEIVKNFNTHLVSKLSQAGNIKNRLDSTSELLDNQKLNLTELLSKEKDVDQAEAIIEMQTEEYNLNTIYRISSMVLPKSLLDYL